MNTRKGKAKFKKFWILLDSGCSSTILIGRLVEKLYSKKDAVMQWHTQASNITTNIKVEVDFILPGLSKKIFVMWKCHLDEYSNGRYDMILGRYLSTELG